ncbi:hypothetical protein GCM10010195_60500 [Kitasatospora griseola]|nr:hypothetical protein GCM10010195_60500 [Kitasatospora griseola]
MLRLEGVHPRPAESGAVGGGEGFAESGEFGRVGVFRMHGACLAAGADTRDPRGQPRLRQNGGSSRYRSAGSLIAQELDGEAQRRGEREDAPESGEFDHAATGGQTTGAGRDEARCGGGRRADRQAMAARARVGGASVSRQRG